MKSRRFGKLVVLEKVGRDRHGNNRWKCLCSCGKYTIVIAAHLRSGHTQSCGCFKKEQMAEGARRANRLACEEASFNSLYASYRYHARRKNRTFKIPKAKFRKLTKLNCFYCGCVPATKAMHHKNQYGTYLYNGIDRLDNNKGYTKDNIVTCCKICNRAKGNMSVEDFIKWIRAIKSTFKEI